MRLIFILIATLSVAMMQETPYPDDHYCLAGPPLDAQKKGHECHCIRICSTDQTAVEHNSFNCQMAGKPARCMCHVDEAACPRG